MADSLLGSAKVRIRPDTSGFAQELDRGISGSLKKMAGVAAAAFAAVGVAGFGKDIIGLASSAQQSIGGVEAVFKNYSKTVLQTSKEADRALGLSGNAYRELATVIGAQLKNAGVPLEDLGVSTDKLISQGADLAAMFGGTTADAVGALSSALKGEMDPIEKYGISLNEAALKAEALSLGVYSGTGNLDANAKAMAVMSLVTKQGADAQGAFAREADTAAGKQARATAQWENFRTTLGEKLLPVFTSVMGFISEKALPALDRLSIWISEKIVPAVRDAASGISAYFAPAVEEIGNFIQNTALPALSSFGGFLRDVVVPALKAAAQWVKNNTDWLVPLAAGVGAMVLAYKSYQAVMTTVQAVTKAYAAVQAALNVVLSMNPIGLVVLALVGLGTSLVVAYQKSETFRDVVNGVWEKVQGVISWAWEKIKGFFNGFMTAVRALGDFFPWLGDKAAEVWNAVTGYFGSLKADASAIFTSLKDFIVGVWTGFRDAVVAIAQNVWDWIAQRFQNMKNAVVSIWTGLKDTVVGVFTGFRDGVINTAQNIWDNVTSRFVRMRDGVVGIFQGIADTVGGIWNRLLDIVKKPVRIVLDFINESIIGNINKVTRVFGLTIPTINYSFATGGIVPGGYSPGRDNALAAVGSGEAIMRPEWTRSVGADYVNAANAAARTGGVSGVRAFLAAGGPGFASGGIVGGSHESGGPFDWIKDKVSDGWNWAKDGIEGLLAKGAGFALKHLVSPAVTWITDNVNNDFVSKLASGAMKQLASKVESWGNAKDSEALAGDASDVRVPGRAGGSPGSGYTALFRTIKAAFPEARLNSGYRPGDPGYHGKGLAADLGWMRAPGGNGNAYMAAMNQWIYDNFPNSRELIYNGLGDNRPNLKNGRNFAYSAATQRQHKNHVHWVYDQGGILEPGLTAVHNKSGKPEAVFNNDQWKTLERMADNGGNQAPLIGSLTINTTEAGPQATVDALSWELRKIKRGAGGYR